MGAYISNRMTFLQRIIINFNDDEEFSTLYPLLNAKFYPIGTEPPFVMQNTLPAVTGFIIEYDPITKLPVEEPPPIKQLSFYVDPEDYQKTQPQTLSLGLTGSGSYLQLTKSRKLFNINLRYEDFIIYEAIAMIAQYSLDSRTPIKLIDYVSPDISKYGAPEYTERLGYIILPLQFSSGVYYDKERDKKLMPGGWGFSFEEISLSLL